MRLLSPLTSASGHVRARLFRDLVLLVLLTVGLLAGAGWYLIDQLKRELAETRIAEASQLVRDEVRNLIVPVEQQLLIARDGLRSAGIGPDERAGLDARFIPILRHMAQVAGAVLADGDGAEYFLRSDGDGWLVRERASGELGVATQTRLGPDAKVLSTEETRLDYDPRRRPWYQAALATGRDEPAWSQPYVFHTLQLPGVTAATAWDADGTTRVVALDVLLDRILATVERISIGRDGRGFLFSSTGGVFVPSSADATPGTPERDRFFSAEERLGGPLFFDAVAAWRDAGRPAEGLIRFASGGTHWWGGFLPLSERASSTWIGVVVPVSETVGVVQSRWPVLALAALVIVALGVGLVLILIRKYSHQLRDLPKLAIDRRDPGRDLEDLILRGEGTHLEFKSTMRTNLHTGKPGKEIELAWLKGVAAFMNTEGGILLLGVADDGTVLGLEADRFENEDKCRLHFKNLVNAHLGAENAHHLRLDLYPLEDKQIGAVECERAETPVFLRDKTAESFLIRNGPSNIELSISRALHYIRGRF
jgi:hypothetical protein